MVQYAPLDMKDADKNNFDRRGGELMPCELMERAADPALVPDGWCSEKIGDQGISSMAVLRIPTARVRYEYHSED